MQYPNVDFCLFEGVEGGCLVLVLVFFESRFLCAVLAVLELTLSGFQLKKSACLCLESAGIKGLHHHHPAIVNFLNEYT